MEPILVTLILCVSAINAGGPHSYSEVADVWCNSSTYSAKAEFGGINGFIRCPDARTNSHCALAAFNYCNKDPECVAFQGHDMWKEGELTWYQPCREVGKDDSLGAHLWIKGESKASTIHAAFKQGPYDKTEGYVAERHLLFTKVHDSTPMRFTYSDTFYATGQKSCFWALRINGKLCPSGDLRADMYVSSNAHIPTTFQGICEGIASGAHVVEVLIGTPVPGHTYTGKGNCYTGWKDGHWSLLAEELQTGNVSEEHQTNGHKLEWNEMMERVDELERLHEQDTKHLEIMQDEIKRQQMKLDLLLEMLQISAVDVNSNLPDDSLYMQRS